MITSAGEEYGVTEVALGLSGATREQLVKLSRVEARRDERPTG